jgi:hypothetical protein
VSTHLHFIIWAYERIESDTGNYIGNSVLDLIAESAESAVRRAESILPERQYRVHQVIEHFDNQPCSKG